MIRVPTCSPTPRIWEAITVNRVAIINGTIAALITRSVARAAAKRRAAACVAAAAANGITMRNRNASTNGPTSTKETVSAPAMAHK